jgi:hypothetical protein
MTLSPSVDEFLESFKTVIKKVFRIHARGMANVTFQKVLAHLSTLSSLYPDNWEGLLHSGILFFANNKIAINTFVFGKMIGLSRTQLNNHFVELNYKSEQMTRDGLAEFHRRFGEFGSRIDGWTWRIPKTFDVNQSLTEIDISEPVLHPDLPSDDEGDRLEWFNDTEYLNEPFSASEDDLGSFFFE